MPANHGGASAPPASGKGFQRWFAVVVWVVAAAVAALQSALSISRPMNDRLADLQVYVGAVRGFVHGSSLYDYAAARTGAPFTYPPFAGIIMIPLIYVNTMLLMISWTIVTIVVVLAIAAVIRQRPSNLELVPRGLAQPVFVLALFASTVVSSNLRFGQVSIGLALLVLLDALKTVPPRYAGIATGIAAAIKLTPLIFIPYLWFTGQRRAAATATGTFAAASLVAFAALPSESRRFWGTELLNVDRVGNIATDGNQSLTGAMLRLSWGDGTRVAVMATFGVAVVLLSYWRARQAAQQGDLLAAVVMVGAASIVFSPVSWTHHQLWLVLAALVPVSSRRSRNLVWAGFVAAVMIAPITTLGAHLPGGDVLENGRLLLAIAVAALVPFAAVRGNAGSAPAAGGSAEAQFGPRRDQLAAVVSSPRPSDVAD